MSIVFSFLYEKRYIAPLYDILDEVMYTDGDEMLYAVVTDVRMSEGRFLYKIQLEDYTVLQDIDEKALAGVQEHGQN
ncbi:hypothetical protein ACH33_09480 [Aneurinibacillus sp. XH2]|nr:hypothetical protein ACH33_09480 [Aneurinibacillus sp. XH2]